MFLLAIGIGNGFSQENKTDSLVIKLGKAKNYKDSVDVYMGAAVSLFNTDPDGVIKYADIADELSLKNKYIFKSNHLYLFASPC